MAVFTAAVMAVLLGVAALTVDLGTQRVAKKDVQALADTVALDVGRMLDGRTRAQIEAGTAGFSSLATATTASINRNKGSVIGKASDLSVRVYLVKLIDDASDPDTALDNYAMSAGVPVQVATSAIPTGVVVSASTRVDFGFARVLGFSSGGATQTSVSTRQSPSVCFSVGTKALTLNTAESALSPLLTGILSVNLGAVGYEGLVDLKNVSLPIADILVKLNVGSTSALATTNVSLAQFMVAAADVARAKGQTAAVAALEAVHLGVPGQAVNLAKILALQTGTDIAGLVANVNLLDILGAAISAANGQNAVALGIPGLAGLTIVEPPQIACGAKGAQAKSSQIRLRLNPILPANGVLGLVGGTTDLNVEVGAGSATIDTDLSCAPESVTLKVVTGAVNIVAPTAPAYGQIQLLVTLSKFLSFLGPLNIVTTLLLNTLGINQVGLDVLLTGSVGTTTETKTVTYPAAPAMPPKLTVPTGGIGSTLTITAAGVQLTPGQNASLLGVLTPLLNASLGLVLSGLVAPIVNQVLNPILTPLLNTVFSTLGIKLGVVDVSLLGRPVCQGVKLIA